MNTKTGIAIAAVVVGSLGAGFAAGTIYTKIRLEKLINAELKSLNEQLQEEVQKVKDYYEAGTGDGDGEEEYVGNPVATPEELAEAAKIASLYHSPDVLTPEQDRTFAEDADIEPTEPEESDISNGTPAVLEDDEDPKAVGERFVQGLLGGDDPKADTALDPTEDHSSTTLILTPEQVERITTGPIKVNKNIFVDYKDVTPPSELEQLQSELERDDDGKIIQQTPYVIPVAEYMNGEDEDLELLTLWWYAGDGTLVDERDIPIPDVEGIVGRANLEHFGVASDDSRVVYVRNNKQKAAYEILKHDGNYAEVVFGKGLGADDDAKRKKAPQKMRESDD